MNKFVFTCVAGLPRKYKIREAVMKTVASKLQNVCSINNNQHSKKRLKITEQILK